MRFALLLSLVACASERHCGRLDPDELVAFHGSHSLSITANETSVWGLAVGDDPDSGSFGPGWEVCVEHDRATIQNHPTLQDCEWQPERYDGGCP